MPIRKLFPRHFGPADTLQIMGKASRPALGPRIRLLLWNIQKGKKTRWLADFLTLREDKDLILLQEAVMNTLTDSVFKESDSWQWVMARSFKDRYAFFETGVKTGALAPSHFQKCIPSEHPEPLVRTRKMILVTSYRLQENNHDLLVLNVHGINFVSIHKYSSQINQILHIIEKHAGPVIVAGDFNTWSARRLNSMLAIANTGGLTEAIMERIGRWHHFNKHLDHVFFRGLELTEVEVLTDITSSDHYPIAVRFDG